MSEAVQLIEPGVAPPVAPGSWPADLVERRRIDALVPYARNARTHTPAQVAQIAESIREWGWTTPVLIDEAGVLIAGHGRVLAAQSLGIAEVPTVTAFGWTDAQKRAYRIADNKLALNSGWDEQMLAAEMGDLREGGFELGTIGFGDDEIEAILRGGSEGDGADGSAGNKGRVGSLAERFLIPPFSVFNAREGWWQDRKRGWLSLGLLSELGRGNNLLNFSDAVQLQRRLPPASRTSAIPGGGSGANSAWKHRTAEGYVSGDEGELTATGTSIFDPVLCEIAYRWFCPPNGLVLDPFAGGSVRGVVAGRLGRRYVGVDLRPEQVVANRQQWVEIGARAAGHRERPAGYLASHAEVEVGPITDPEVVKAALKLRAPWLKTLLRPLPSIVYFSAADEGRMLGAWVGAQLVGYLLVKKRVRARTLEVAQMAVAEDAPSGAGRLLVSRAWDMAVAQGVDALVVETLVANERAQRFYGAFGFAQQETVDDDVHFVIGLAAGAAASAEPRWIEGDARDIGTLCADVDADFVLSCPPYGSLERYSDDPRDLSTMDHDDFMAAYRSVVVAACERLRPNRFACFVVGEFRGPTGSYRGFVGDTVRAFMDAGLAFHNEAILVTAVGSLPLRVNAQFTGTRKLGKTHQNVLVFVKGDPEQAAAAVGPCEFGDPAQVEIGSDSTDAAPLGGEIP